MTDIFISYASEDRPKAELVAKALEDQGWSVWWDRKIQPGKTFSLVIEEAINAAKCVIVLWSEESVKSDWVQNEAAEGARKGILVPALIDNVQIPFEFKRIQAADLTDWKTGSHPPGFIVLLSAISEIVRPSPLKVKETEQKSRALKAEVKTDRPEPDTKSTTEPVVSKSHKTSRAVKFGAVGVVIVLLIVGVMWWFSPQKAGVYLLKPVNEGQKISENMLKIVKPKGNEETSDDRPMNFERHLRGARFKKDLPEGHVLEWEDLIISIREEVKK